MSENSDNNFLGFVVIIALVGGIYYYNRDNPDDYSYTLYRNSLLDSSMRVHIATFNSAEYGDRDGNKQNCESIAKWQNDEYFKAAPKPVRTYGFWCEQGLYNEEGYNPTFNTVKSDATVIGDDNVIVTLDNGTEWTLDVDTMSGPREKRQAWLTANHENDKTNKFRSTKTLYIANCTNFSYITPRSVAYLPNGDATNLYEYNIKDLEYTFAVPETNGHGVIQTICKQLDGPQK